MTPKPIQQPAITHHQRCAIACAEWLFGSRAFWSPPHPASTSARAHVNAASASARLEVGVVSVLPRYPRQMVRNRAAGGFAAPTEKISRG
jgi:hypothetical protein